MQSILVLFPSLSFSFSAMKRNYDDNRFQYFFSSFNRRQFAFSLFSNVTENKEKSRLITRCHTSENTISYSQKFLSRKKQKTFSVIFVSLMIETLNFFFAQLFPRANFFYASKYLYWFFSSIFAFFRFLWFQFNAIIIMWTSKPIKNDWN